NNEEKEQMLNSTLELAVEKKNSKLQLKICNSLGEYYFKEEDYVKTLNCYVGTCILVKNIVFSVPVEFRIQFINSNNMLKYFNILAQVKGNDSKLDGNNHKKYDCINNENELIEFFEDLDKIIR
ncbi:hypothetical protein, partial [Clostridium sp.]|uniref:hypothetical protein n=1 Tax=Clostridium sp. TaxID=1506 RepID=UPI001A4E333B